MAQKKESKKDIKVQDLAPKKDAKGGAARRSADGGRSLDGGRSMDGGRSLNAGTRSADGNRGGLN